MEKRSFFERLTGGIKIENLDEPKMAGPVKRDFPQQDEDAQLTVDVSKTPDAIVIQAIVGGVRPEDLDVQVTHDTATLRGRREKSKEISTGDYFIQELYWGTFSRSILLPQEVDADEAEATFKNGLLTIKLPLLDKSRISRLRVKNE